MGVGMTVYPAFTFEVDHGVLTELGGVFEVAEGVEQVQSDDGLRVL